jgi:hypothetical protein
MEQPKILVEDDCIEPEIELDDEDTEDLLYDCYDLLSRVIERQSNPKWLANEGNRLLTKLEASLGWNKLH